MKKGARDMTSLMEADDACFTLLETMANLQLICSNPYDSMDYKRYNAFMRRLELLLLLRTQDAKET